jgi:response regulator of citrate/malate metabolism
MVKSEMLFEEILLIDDNRFCNYFTKDIILEMRITKEIIVAENGLEGLNYLKGCRVTKKYPGLILLDMIMPMVDGIDFMRKVEAMKLLKDTSTSVIGLTSGGNDERIKKMQGIGLSGIMYKPLDKEKFSAILGKLYKNYNACSANSPSSGSDLW